MDYSTIQSWSYPVLNFLLVILALLHGRGKASQLIGLGFAVLFLNSMAWRIMDLFDLYEWMEWYRYVSFPVILVHYILVAAGVWNLAQPLVNQRRSREFKPPTAMEMQDTIDIRPLRDPGEGRLVALLSFLSIVAIAAILVISYFAPTVLVAILVGFVTFLIMLQIFTRIARAFVLGNSIKVGPEQFSRIHEIKLNVMQRLNYDRDVEVYVINDGSVNAIFTNFLKTRYIILSSSLVKSMQGESGRDEMTWIIASVIGHFKAKHFRFWFLRFLISIEKLNPLPYFAYERMCHYTADRVAMVTCGNPSASIRALLKFTIGPDVDGHVRMKALEDQINELDGSVAATLAVAWERYPHLLKRIKTLIRHIDAMPHTAQQAR